VKFKLDALFKKPKKKYSSQEQKHHYWEAAKHYRAWKEKGISGDEHIEAFRQHVQAGKLSQWHKDQIQHDSNHIKGASHATFKPFPGKKKKLKKGADMKSAHEKLLDWMEKAKKPFKVTAIHSGGMDSEKDHFTHFTVHAHSSSHAVKKVISHLRKKGHQIHTVKGGHHESAVYRRPKRKVIA